MVKALAQHYTRTPLLHPSPGLQHWCLCQALDTRYNYYVPECPAAQTHATNYYVLGWDDFK